MVLEFFSIFHKMPLWVFSWAAISFGVYWIFPEIPFRVNLSVIGLFCKITSLLWAKYCKKPEPVKTFHLTLNEERSYFEYSRKSDGKMRIRIYSFFEAKNLINEHLRINKARILKPKIKGNNQTYILIQGPDGIFDRRNSIPCKVSRNISVDFFIDGLPRRLWLLGIVQIYAPFIYEYIKQKGEILDIELAVSDGAGNEQIIKVPLNRLKS